MIADRLTDDDTKNLLLLRNAYDYVKEMEGYRNVEIHNWEGILHSSEIHALKYAYERSNEYYPYTCFRKDEDGYYPEDIHFGITGVIPIT